MVDIAQQVEHLIVVQKVARSNRVIHPKRKPRNSSDCEAFQHRESFMHYLNMPELRKPGVLAGKIV